MEKHEITYTHPLHYMSLAFTYTHPLHYMSLAFTITFFFGLVG